MLGKRNTKRKQEEQVRREEAREEARGPAEGQGGPPVGGGEEAQTTTTPPPPKRRRREEEEFPTTGMVGVEGATKVPVDYSSWTLKDLKCEMKVRRMKPGSRDREELVRDLLREDRSQGRIEWRKGAIVQNVPSEELRNGGGDEGREDKEAQLIPGLSEEAEWEDIPTVEEDMRPRSETAEVDQDETRLRPRITKPKRVKKAR